MSIAQVPIADVWRRLGGAPIRNGRAVAFWRGGDAPNIAIDARRGVWHDFAREGGGGVLDLVCTVRDCEKREAAAWLVAEGFIEDRQASPAERRKFAEQRNRDRFDMPKAEAWRIAAESLNEELLDTLSATAPERFGPTQELLRLRAVSEHELLELYRAYRAREPELTAALVHAGAKSWDRLSLRLARFMSSRPEVRNAA